MIDTVHEPINEWAHAPANNELGEGEAHVWRASLDQSADIIARLAPRLSKDEYQRAERFHHPSDRRRFIAGRGILRKIISAYLAHAPDEIRFVYNKYGKPFISDDQNHGALGFNLSHFNGMALYAFTRRRRVGVDIEYMREDFATLEVAESFFSKDEFDALKAAPTKFLGRAPSCCIEVATSPGKSAR